MKHGDADDGAYNVCVVYMNYAFESTSHRWARVCTQFGERKSNQQLYQLNCEISVDMKSAFNNYRTVSFQVRKIRRNQDLLTAEAGVEQCEQECVMKSTMNTTTMKKIKTKEKKKNVCG